MSDRPLKILLFCDASNYHRCLAEGLRRKGHEVVVASDGNRWMRTDRDIDLSRPFDNKIGGAMLWVKAQRLIKKRMTGFDIVSVANSTFPFLRPERMKKLLDALSEGNRNIFVNCLGTDPFYLKACLDTKFGLKYTEWKVDGKDTRFCLNSKDEIARWFSPELVDLYKTLYTRSRGVTTALYEYDMSCRFSLPDTPVGYAGIPVDTDAIAPVEISDLPDKVRLFLGRHRDRQLEKGTDRLFEAAKRVAERFPDKCQLEVVENLPYKEYIERMRSSHVVLDQIYSYTPATNALLAMAMGLNTVSGAEEDYYKFIGETNLHPIINALPDDEYLFRTLEETVLNPEKIRQRGLQGREFVEKHNSVDVVADRMLNFWKANMK